MAELRLPDGECVLSGRRKRLSDSGETENQVPLRSGPERFSPAPKAQKTLRVAGVESTLKG